MDYLFVDLSMMCYTYFYCIGFLGYVLPFYAKNGIGLDQTLTFIIEPASAWPVLYYLWQ